MASDLAASNLTASRITGLPIVEEMYAEFIAINKLILDKKLSTYFQTLFSIWLHLFTRMYRPRFTEWMKEFILERLDTTPLKNLSPSIENFENIPNPNIDDELYMQRFGDVA